MKITPVTSTQSLGGTLNVRRANANDFGLDTREASQNLDELGRYVEQRNQQEAAVSTAKTVAQTRTDMDKLLLDSQESAPAGAPDFTKTFTSQFDEYASKALEAEENPAARRLLEVKFAEIRGAYGEQAARFEASARKEKKLMDLGQIGDQYSNLVAVNPGQYGTLRKELEAATVASGLDGNAQEKFLNQQYGIMAASSFKARILTDPDGVIRDLKSGKGAAADLPAGAAATLMHMADAQIKHEIAKGKSAVLEDTKDSITLMRQGYDVPEEKRNQILELFGDNPKERDQLLEAFDSAKQFGDTVKATAMASPEEVNAALMGYETTAADQSVDVGARELAMKDKAMLQTVVKQRNEQIKQQPADYVLANSEATNQSFKNFMEIQRDPNADEAAVATAQADFVSSMKADQRRLGVPESGITLFNSSMVSQVKDRVNSVEHSPEGAKNLLGTLTGLHDTWGKDWPVVYRQLREEKAIDGPLDALGYMTDPRKRADAAVLATAWANKDALNKQLSDEIKKDINEAVEQTALPLGTAMSNEGRNDQFINFKEASKLLAMQYTADGMAPAAAAERAFNRVVGSDYHVVGKMRIPVSDENNVAIDPDTVLEGSILAKREALSDVSQIKSLAGQSDKSIQFEMPEHIENAYWVTANGNQGLQLKWADKTVVERKDGTPIIYTWDQLKDLTVKAKTERQKKVQQDEIDEMFGTGKYAPQKPRQPNYDVGPE